MKERFEGPTRRNQLVAALAQQRICLGISGLPERLADVCEFVEFDNGEKFITQGDQTNDVLPVAFWDDENTCWSPRGRSR
ncbi:hypothetical protein [Paraburkholderia phenazinium]|uniref:hypothetical protein n=1 Tax=Paraburkholderia phenazinium TaxID=60549 RepID=UPI001FC83FBA|nr:hypothetical protein [Paraburkholderia phenazinium]